MLMFHKILQTTTIEKDPILECTHKNREQCHYTYVTQFTPSQEEVTLIKLNGGRRGRGKLREEGWRLVLSFLSLQVTQGIYRSPISSGLWRELWEGLPVDVQATGLQRNSKFDHSLENLLNDKCFIASGAKMLPSHRKGDFLNLVIFHTCQKGLRWGRAGGVQDCLWKLLHNKVELHQLLSCYS